jgi:rhamnosyltransferase
MQEDQMFGRDIIEAGYWKAYAPRASSNFTQTMSCKEFGLRDLRRTVGLRRIGASDRYDGAVIKYSLLTCAAHDSTLDRSRSWIRESRNAKLYWLVNPLYHAKKWANYRRASICGS